MDYSTPGFPVFTIFRSLLKLMSIESVMPSNHLILCRALLLLPSICLHWTKDNLMKFTKAVGYMNIWMEKNEGLVRLTC